MDPTRPVFPRAKQLGGNGLDFLLPVVEECRPILDRCGMDAVQQHLADTGVAIVPAIAVTRGLLGWDDTPLAVARDIVCASAARNGS
ncbi:hypothetical protein [Streptacidiphilus sp. MAP5-3]|uniref:hypothetical protein n=1 Tax=unclassified Streptacidiphilus TaxID=2643834 RepID=UPI0035132D23